MEALNGYFSRDNVLGCLLSYIHANLIFLEEHHTPVGQMLFLELNIKYHQFSHNELYTSKSHF